MENIIARMESKSPGTLKIELSSRKDYDDGTIILSAIVKEGYTGEILLNLDWYCDFAELMRDLDNAIKTI